jgi:hypothetical protein
MILARSLAPSQLAVEVGTGNLAMTSTSVVMPNTSPDVAKVGCTDRLARTLKVILTETLIGIACQQTMIPLVSARNSVGKTKLYFGPCTCVKPKHRTHGCTYCRLLLPSSWHILFQTKGWQGHPAGWVARRGKEKQRWADQ